MEGTSNDKSEERKTAAGLRYNEGGRYDQKDRIDDNKNLSSSRAYSQGDPHEWEENQMTRPKWYTPQLMNAKAVEAEQSSSEGAFSLRAAPTAC
jgi:hypothetical protein